MITLNDYLYSGDTVLKILYRYEADLRKDAKKTGNQIDMAHCNFLLQMIGFLEHNDFLTDQSQRIREFYYFMADQYPYLAFTFKGRIKSLIRAEEKFNGYLVEYIYDYYMNHNSFPCETELKDRLNKLRDLIAYRIVISLPQCHLKEGENREEVEEKLLFEIANQLPEFMENRGFTAEMSTKQQSLQSDLLRPEVRGYYKDYITNTKRIGYKSLHITFFDNLARTFLELQIRTKDMDDYAEIGPANHLGYEKKQEVERARRDVIPQGECIYFDQAYERGMMLQKLELAKVDVNMFAAVNNTLINDGCGLYRGRQILPYEHLSRFQND